MTNEELLKRIAECSSKFRVVSEELDIAEGAVRDACARLSVVRDERSDLWAKLSYQIEGDRAAP